MIAREKERMCRFVLILSWLFFAIVMFLFCFGSIKLFGVKRLRLPSSSYLVSRISYGIVIDGFAL